MSLTNERNEDVDTATVQRLLDESELRKLIQAVPRTLDERDFDGYGAQFTEDAVMEIGGKVRRGRQAIIDGPKHDLATLYEATFHHMGQIYIDIHGDEATILTYQVAYHLPKVSEPMTHEDAGGKYHAVARRTENGWRIARLRLEIVLTQGASLSLDV
ncbi:nuclear transport factor 2 family protein [Streptomyces sp. NPDC006356]